MDFKDLKVGDSIYILENAGTFVKTNTYHVGTVANVGQAYEDNQMLNPYLNNLLKKKLVDVTISCNGVLKKLSVSADKNMMSDSAIGLTIATDKKDLILLLTLQYNECEAKIASIEYYKNEADKCRQILELLKDKPILPTQENITTDTIKVD